MKFKPKSEDKRNFLKMKPGESLVGVFRGELYDFRMHWVDKRGVVCPDKDCELCAAGNKSKFRFRVNFVTKEGDTLVAKLIEQGWTFYDLLRAANTDYPLEKHFMKITRHGEGLHTNYTVFPIPNGLVGEEAEAKLKAVVLNELGHITESETEIEPPQIEDSDIPF